jgi:hypothetical protein
MKTKAVPSVLILILIVSLTACATWKQNTTAGYEITGVTLTQVHDTAKALCDAGTLKDADCVKIKALYNDVRTTYIDAGNALIAAMNAEDDITRATKLGDYTKAMNDIAVLVPKLMKLAQDLGIKTGGN